MSFRSAILVGSAFLCGFAFRSTVFERPSRVPESITLLHVSDPSAEPIRLIVHRASVGGNGLDICAPVGNDLWRVDLSERTVLFGTTPSSR